MAEIRDLPGQLDVVLYVGRPTTLTLTWPSTLAGRTFTCQVSYGGAAPITYTVAIATVTMTIVLAATDYAAESGPGTFRIIETTGGLTTPVIVGAVTVTRTPGASSTTSTVNLTSSTASVTVGSAVTVVSVGTLPSFANAASRDAIILVPTTGMLVELVTPASLFYYNGSAWVDVQGGVWASYTPTWGGTIGNGSITGKFQLVGKTVNWRVKIMWGSTTSHPASIQQFSLPVAAHGDFINAAFGTGGVNIGGVNYTGMPWFTSSTTFFVKPTDLTNFWTNVLPAAWANSNVFVVSGSYEAA